jgi:hypothetical protein
MRLDFDKAKGGLRKIAEDLRGTRLWPLVIVMLVAIVAVPIALSKSSSGTPVAAAPSGTPPPSADTALPALNVESKPGRSHLPGRGRDPFPQKGSNQPASQSSTGTTTTSGSGSGSGSGSSSASGTSGNGTTGGGATTSGSGGSASSSSAPPQSTPAAPPSITPPNKRPAPPTAGLAPDQAYRVSIGITNSSGGVDTIDPLQRLSVLPAVQQPRLVELGVLGGGSRVLFAVQPGTVVGGPGECIPGPVDCELLSLRQQQTEGISLQSSAGNVPIAEFAVTGITAQRYPSVAAATRARRAESSDGRALLRSSKLGALSLFRYQPSVGAVVDLSSLSAGDGR